LGGVVEGGEGSAVSLFSSSSIIAANVSNGMAPTTRRPLTKNVGVEVTTTLPLP
jgi:hypothetical protein